MFRSLLIVCGLCVIAQANEPHQAATIAKAEHASPLAWAGPGLYEGEWFDTEEEYHAYLTKSDRHHDRHKSRDRHDDKHRKHHHKDKKKDHHHKHKKHHK